MDNDELSIAIVPEPDHVEIAKAAAGGTIWAGHAHTFQDFEKLIPEAVDAVKRCKGVVLDVHLEVA